MAFDLNPIEYNSPSKSKIMDNARKEMLDKKKKIEQKSKGKEEKKKIEEKIDEELDQSFPASDPPSYSQPGNDDIKDCE
jgi:hypothetical protein